MRLFIIIWIFTLTLPLTAFAQKDNWLSVKMKNADTVLLVSHEVTAGVQIEDSLGNRMSLPKLIVNGRPNNAIIKEQQIITGAQLDTFTKILVRPFADRTIETGKCFMPHHAVFIIKKSQISYLDICFGCRGFNTSKDLRQLYAFDNRKWTELERYFVKLGFKYKLTDE
jgi:hypothetical protein